MFRLKDIAASPLRRLRSSLKARAEGWTRKRQGPDQLQTHLHRRRIYILPTRAGLVFAVVVFMLLIGSLNYANNMGFVLTFTLTGLGLVAMHHCHRNLAGLTLSFSGSQPVFAGETAQLAFVINNESPVYRSQIDAGLNGAVDVCGDIEPDGRAQFQLPLQTRSRGWLTCPRIRVSTTYPLGLFRAWAWVYMDIRTLVYPRPVAAANPVFSAVDEAGISGQQQNGDDEFSGLREYRHGDPPKSIAWKSAAALGELLVKEYQEGGQSPLWIDWEAIAIPDVEVKLSTLCRLLLDADSNRQTYGLRLPGNTLPPAKGAAHLARCLQELALYGAQDDCR